MASVKIKPLEDKILVQANEAETTTASGLVIPDTAQGEASGRHRRRSRRGVVSPRRATGSRSTSKKATPSSTASTAAPRSSTPARST